ncbi:MULTISPECIES: FAD/NAD(P)-binding protein [unclassified Pedobacter]|uniref:FAD/NAD(P)-binding protein n=1 Tax=unclassified Pedobacter TaxID=2628915 RepID=UPI001DEE61B9|nr:MULTISPECIES: FAD/NAD(P)-binding protein [unclassified Pedobacter]CAH0146724.1 Putative thiazole biosynthetic enzyme [Pedobacter sp. Bi126]CAH0211626.1 Putative thiazole biosynthetic enzyme [Pedobacter sp. Bi36]
MDVKKAKKKIAIIGGGPSGLFMYKRLTEAKATNFEIDIFERKNYLGAGMPYSAEGANVEHITNVSDNEIPIIFNSIEDWVKIAPKAILKKFNISEEKFDEYKVLPRLFFGEYLSAQFNLLKKAAAKKGIKTNAHLNCIVEDIIDVPDDNKVAVCVQNHDKLYFDQVIISTGHNWPKKYEGRIPDYFDSPYPPKKISLKLDHAVGIMGSSLTAIDALRTLARQNGKFTDNEDGTYAYDLESKGFKIVMHSRSGLLPAIRFHLEDSHLGKEETLSKAEIQASIAKNGGFLPLDFVFEKNFKEMFIEKDPVFYKQIKEMNLEEFVGGMMAFREKIEPFDLFKKEYEEAEKSIEKRKSIYWKEALAVLSFAMNYPAKYLSAEDMKRLQKVLMPLISIVIAFVPQSSCRELLALHEAGVLSIVAVGDDAEVEPLKTGGADYHYKVDDQKITVHFDTFIDCVGQPHLSFDDFPFKSLIKNGTVSPAMLQFQSAKIGKAEMKHNDLVIRKGNTYFLTVPGITINDHFQVVNEAGQVNERIYIMAVPYIGGYNPDYSGIDFCEAASEAVLKRVLEENGLT